MNESPDQDAAKAPAPKKSKLVPVLLIVVILLLAGGGAGAYVLLARKGGDKAGEKKAAPAASGIVILDPFTVNLADTDAPRFLRVTLRLVVDDDKVARELTEDPVRMTKARSAVLELLTTQQSSRLTTPDGKTELKHQIAERTTKVLSPIEVRDVLFAEFVVQF